MSIEVKFPDAGRKPAEIAPEMQEQFVNELLELQCIAAQDTNGLSLVKADIPELEPEVLTIIRRNQAEIAMVLMSQGIARLGTPVRLRGAASTPQDKDIYIEARDSGVYVEGEIAGSRIDFVPDVAGQFDSAEQRVIPSVMLRLRHAEEVSVDEQGNVTVKPIIGGDVYVPLAYSEIGPELLHMPRVHKVEEVKFGGQVIDAYRGLFAHEDQNYMIGPVDIEKPQLSVEQQEIHDRQLSDLLGYLQAIIDKHLEADGREVNNMTKDEIRVFIDGVAPLVASAVEGSSVLYRNMPFISSGPGLMGIAEIKGNLVHTFQLVPNCDTIAGIFDKLTILPVPTQQWVEEHREDEIIEPCNDECISVAAVIKDVRYFSGSNEDGSHGPIIDYTKSKILVPAVYKMPTTAVRLDFAQ